MSEQSREWREGYAAGLDATGGGVEKLALDRARKMGYAEGFWAAKRPHDRVIRELRLELFDERRRFGKLVVAFLDSKSPDLATRFAAFQQESHEREEEIYRRYLEGAEKTNTGKKVSESKLVAAVDEILKTNPRIAAMSASSAAVHICDKPALLEALPLKDRPRYSDEENRQSLERKIADVIRGIRKSLRSASDT